MIPDDWEYLPATSAMTIHLRLLTELAEEALASHDSLVQGLERSLKEAARYAPSVDHGKTASPAQPAPLPSRPRPRPRGAIVTAFSSLIGKTAFA